MERDGRQRDAIVKLVLDFLGERMRPGAKARDLLATDEIDGLVKAIEAGITNGSIPAGEKVRRGLLKKRKGPDADGSWRYPLRSYARSILFCWMRRDDRLNGGIRRRDVSEMGQVVAADAQVRNLKLLIAKEESQPALGVSSRKMARLESALETRIHQLNVRGIEKSALVVAGMNDEKLQSLFKKLYTRFWMYEDERDPELIAIKEEIVCRMADLKMKYKRTG